jgi:ABC-type nitrate/sulfonate/bicarbonate transport system ATPase subunit
MFSFQCWSFQARITLARAIYSSAKILLLDDIFSALDVHTSRWIMEQCLAGPLLRGRTVLLVTHNVILASPFAHYMVILAAAGTVQSQGIVESMLKNSALLLSATVEEQNGAGNKEHEEEAGEQNRLQQGKQIMEEEMAIGHIGWPVCEHTD